MRLDRFEAERSAGWARLEALLDRAGGRPGRLPAAELREAGAAYRRVAADLALARRAFPAEAVTARLDVLVTRARQLVYAEAGPGHAPLSWLGRGYWRAVRALGPALAASCALFFGAMALATVWGATDPDAARGVIPGIYLEAADPPTGDQGLSAARASAFSAEVFTNNIQVALLCFAAGLVFCVGGAALLAYNGMAIGALLGVAVDAGTIGEVLRLVAAHGVLELSCIAVTGAAGLRVGWALVDPGPRTRSDVLGAAVRPAMAVVLGTLPWIVAAGLAEGFASPSGISGAEAAAIGLGLGATYWGLVLARGGAGGRYRRERALARR
jgi:uncharacterized membrane protein SpoIIM required for sporulation